MDGLRRPTSPTRFDVLAWDLPGHGHNRSVPEEPFTMAELAAGVLAVVDDVLAERGEVAGSFSYAGDSVGGAVGLQLLLDAPARVRDAVLVCTGARIGDEASWSSRIEQVRSSGTAGAGAGHGRAVVRARASSTDSRRSGSALLHALRDAADEGYVQVCAALRDFDVRDRLSEIERAGARGRRGPRPRDADSRLWPRSPTAYVTGSSSSSTTSPTWPRPRRPRRSPG